MSTHPNVILMAVLKPDDLSRKTMRDIIGDVGDDIPIGDNEYHTIIMETDFDVFLNGLRERDVGICNC